MRTIAKIVRAFMYLGVVQWVVFSTAVAFSWEDGTLPVGLKVAICAAGAVCALFWFFFVRYAPLWVVFGVAAMIGSVPGLYFLGHQASSPEAEHASDPPQD
ncbi:hypothetical protein HK107_10115 [Parvularcula sp. ZS-1/3]|uniref:Uncharacterized protein n=1 Tax=Parvularcula mediterranea TaxID=2732508 RepID=A0A7Y3RME9_9PROT|nr:hypothetical protein [Parvularcula mediterranea]NNU16675.1 hypothetical protein [Parvularcula mediterranea]